MRKGVGLWDAHFQHGVDADGVALAAIQGLYETVKEKEAENASLRQRVESLESRLAALEKMVS